MRRFKKQYRPIILALILLAIIGITGCSNKNNLPPQNQDVEVDIVDPSGDGIISQSNSQGSKDSDFPEIGKPEDNYENSMLTIREVVDKVLNGQYGNGEQRKQEIEADGFSYEVVRKAVQERLYKVNGKYNNDYKDLEVTTEDDNQFSSKENVDTDSKHEDIVIIPPTKIKSNSEIAREVLDGKWGNGSERISKLKHAGYNYEHIQKELDILIGSSNIDKEIKDGQVEREYNLYSVYINGDSMYYKHSNYENLQTQIDSTWKTWITAGDYPKFNPKDNKGTFFAMHNDRGGDVIMELKKDDEIIVTDSEGKPHYYIVDKLYYNNMTEEFTDELAGALDKEYVIFQTCEYGDDNGNRHIIATKKSI